MKESADYSKSRGRRVQEVKARRELSPRPTRAAPAPVYKSLELAPSTFPSLHHRPLSLLSLNLLRGSGHPTFLYLPSTVTLLLSVVP